MPIQQWSDDILVVDLTGGPEFNDGHEQKHARPGDIQWRVGGTMQHSPRFSSFVRYDEIDLLESKLLTYGFSYILTTKYEVGFRQRMDFTRDESQSIAIWLERRLPKWRLRLVTSIDEIDDNESIGIVLIPEGFGGGPSPLIR